MPRSSQSDASTPSPCVTSSASSVDSTPLHSPAEGFLVIDPKPPTEPQTLQFKFPSDDSPTQQRMAALARPRHLSLGLPPSPLYTEPITKDAYLATCSPRSPRQHYPYIPRRGPIPPGLRYVARSLGIMPPIDLMLGEAEEQRDTFLDALSAMPDRILQSAYLAKLADRDSIAQRVALTTAEIKSSEARISFLSAIREQHDGDLALSDAYLTILNQMLDVRGLTEAEGERCYYRNERTAQLAALAVAQTHMTQMYDVIGPGCSRWLDEEMENSSLPLGNGEEDAVEDSG